MQIFYFPKNFWKGLLMIFLAYSTIHLLPYLQLFNFDYNFTAIRQPIRWLAITLVYLVGVRVLNSSNELWLLTFWHLVHISLITYLIVIAFIEYFIIAIPYGIRASVAPIVEFLISPVLYMCAGLIYHAVQVNKIK
jgi:hypothetical protein